MLNQKFVCLVLVLSATVSAADSALAQRWGSQGIPESRERYQPELDDSNPASQRGSGNNPNQKKGEVQPRGRYHDPVHEELTKGKERSP
jgi:hypothetical protein